MTHSPSTTSLGLAYNAFLYASIRDEVGATPLTTVSALARLDIDPWQEAAELARLPRESATQRLAALLARLPGAQMGPPDSETTASRLVGLLPSRASGESVVAQRAKSGHDAVNLTFVALAFGMAAFVLLTGLLGAPADRPGSETRAKPAAASGAPGLAAPQPTIRR
jgi:hypothetical protein